MPSRCWILGCPSNVDRSNTKFFKFPHDEELKQLWIDAIGRDVAPSDFSRVCSKHFRPEDVESLSIIPLVDSANNIPSRLKLREGAVPCVFEGLVPRRQRKKSSPKRNLSPEKTKNSKVMPRKCCVPGCKSNYNKEAVYTTVFQFPSDPDKKKLWLEKINRENFKPSASSVVCIKHFEESCIIREDRATRDDGTELVVPRNRCTLTADAVPTIFEILTPSKTSTPKKKRVVKKKKEVSKSEEKSISNSELEKETIANESLNKSASNTDIQSGDEEDKIISLSDSALDSSTSEIEKNIDTSPTTDKPIITILKAQEDIEKPISDDEEEIIPLEQLKSPIIKSNMRKILNDLPSPYKHLPTVSVCLKEEDRVILTQDESKSLKRSSSVSSNNSNSVTENAKVSPLPKRRKVEKPAPIVIGRQNDAYCWACHRENIVLTCIACPRAYHLKCAGEISEPSDWVCLECRRILTAENVDTRSSVLSEISVDKLGALLRFCLNKMKHRAMPPFQQPVSLEHYPMYLHYVIHPMDFSLLEKNIKQKLYGCTEAFLADVKWILHNSCVFNGNQHPLSGNAKALVKACETDMQEIEVCPDCFMHSVIRNKYWFADVCRKPHPLVWAKLKGFPYWPAKVVRILDGNVDARFFGAHDRAWVPITQCYHLSKETPTTSKPKKKVNYDAALDELNVHVQLLIQKFGKFDYASSRTVFDPMNKKLMYHGVDIDKVDKEEIPFDASAANSKAFCPSPTGERRMSLDSKMDVDHCEEASSNSMFSTAETRIARMLSCEDEKEILDSSKDKTENKTQETTSGKSKDDKEKDLFLDDPPKSKPTSNVPRDKLEMALERIKGYVSLDTEEEKESSNKEDEPDKSESVKETNVSSEGTTSILANLMKAKSLPKIDLPDIPAIEEETTTKEKESFLDMSKKNDTFKLHLLETIKKARSRAAADDEEDESDMETDEEDSDSDSVIDEEGKEVIEENESDGHEDKEVIDTVTDEEGDDTESESENESSSESSETDIEEIEEESDKVSKNVEKQDEDAEIRESNERDSEIVESSEKSDIPVHSITPKKLSPDTNKNIETKSTEKSPTGKQLNGSLEIQDSGVASNITLGLQQVSDADTQKGIESSEENLDENKNDDVEDDEVIICPPVKPPTPPLICLDDGTETESENEDGNKVTDADKMSGKNENLSILQTTKLVEKPSVVRFLKFNANEVSLSREKIFPRLRDLATHRRNNKRSRISTSSSGEESSDDGLVVDRNTGVPLRGARRTFNNFKNRSISASKSNSVPESQEMHESPADDLESRLDHRKNSVDNSLAETSSVNEPRISVEQSMISDGFNQENSPEKGPLDEKDMEIIRLKKKLKTLLTAFKLQHWKLTQEKLELRHNMNLIIMEMRASLEAEKKQAVETLSRKFDHFKQKAVNEVKRNQWCAFCLNEARYQCCWNTNYCSVNCQKRDFLVHKKVCTRVKHKPSSTVIGDSGSEPKDNKKVYVVNMVSKSDSKSSQLQIVPANSNVSVLSSTTTTSVPSTNVQYIVAQPTMKSSDSTTHEVSKAEEKQVSMDTSEIIKNVRNRNCDLSTAITLLNKKNLETAASSEENKTKEPDLEEIYFPSPPPVSFEGLDTASADESILISQSEASEKNSSDTEILSQEDKKGDSSAEEEINFSDNDDADNEQVSIGNGVEIKAKFLNKCLIYGKTAKRLTRCLVDVLFPDLKQLATCSAFGQKSNVTKLTRAALPGKKVTAILEFVQKRFPTATRTEIVLAINMKCKEARNIVDKQDGEKPVKRNLFRRLLARDQSLEVNKTSTATTTTGISVTTGSMRPKAPIMVMRQPPTSKSITLKTPPLSSEPITSPTKIVNSPNILRCSPQVLIRPKFLQPGDKPNSQPKFSPKTFRTLLPSPQPIGISPREPRKIILPYDAYKKSVSPRSSAGTNPSPRPYIILGTSSSSSPQSLAVTQPSSLPLPLLRK
ncbi:MYND-type zinc finger-containing chromatin reader ZMYND8 isoform X2 [Parasteatoda tepidariorum]|uniref:MYND-type zinc finger-containing chromatin reader ZMYND8 isoform X2 n=1 Tax=Parasteatoda tepidariorum TaxID=114398 RepID=UPI00077F9C1B|nr:uncharacterized protein LOC107448205 isoform X2 [Parasteatoda tepidariorum]